ncbi:MAG: sensor domain-containing diguanylate cyclase [Candidatus Omnitrophica bacterium]|jgi:diguanylate cyclase (GGDEF)-like protein|nr:sensor domain-containing diguanylate cyclase [Candidatus Omnitrophota bacterium]
MLNLELMEELNKLNQELERTKTELAILYEISNAMRTTLKLDEILYIILTGVTAHTGLGFNRAILFLINEKDGLIEGKMAIAPESGEEANRVWRRIEQEQMDLEDLISAYQFSKSSVESAFNQQIRRMKIPLREQNGGMLALSVLDGMPLNLNREAILKYSNDPIIQLLKPEELIVVPLKAKDKVNGIILADNFVTKKPITKDDARMLIMLANQAGLAIENSQLYEKTVLRSHSDYLTELWNHGHFQYLFQAELEKAKATKTPLTLIMIDIDDFKIYNDQLGHQAGDQILRELSTLLKKQSRKMDFVCRYGGEEFTIILPQTDKDEAFAIAERLRQDIARQVFAHEEILPNKKLTVSLGLAAFPADGTTTSSVINHSDKMLYQAKNKGKNTTCR